MLLRLEHDAVLRFFVNFDLRMVGTHVALRASGGQARDAHGSRVARVASGAIPDGSVGVGLSDAVALLASAGHGGGAFELHERMRRPARSAGLKGLRKFYLFGSEVLHAVNRSPCRSRVTAAQELLIDIFVAAPAIPCSEFCGNEEAVMV